MRRILVIKHGALGDFVLATGPFTAIRAHHLGDNVTLLTTPPYVELARQSRLRNRPELGRFGQRKIIIRGEITPVARRKRSQAVASGEAGQILPPVFKHDPQVFCREIQWLKAGQRRVKQCGTMLNGLKFRRFLSK